MKETKPSETASAFLNMLREIQLEYDANYELVNIKDKEDCDIQHEIEFEPHYKPRARLSTQLRNVRRERRIAKNFTQDYRFIVEFLEKNKPLLDKLGALLGMLRKAEEPKHREYVPRIRTDESKPSVESVCTACTAHSEKYF